MVQIKQEVSTQGGIGNGDINCTAARRTHDSDNEAESNGSDDDDDDVNEAENSSVQKTRTQQSRVLAKKKASQVKKKQGPVSDTRIARLLINLIGKGLEEAVEWLKESLADAIEDFEDDDSCEGIPLVPIMDYAVNAMENADFQETLKALGIVEPFDEQVLEMCNTYLKVCSFMNSYRHL
ncbi:hypothetical protein Zmor_001358 [Zophobas morio]|uniref:Timeless C-terminal domain-containing protein n=1 Tax=Zophobas morio TaxID=2755281 RepID=A0AA38J8Q4_9CUCU|nr:hypothetical protein Zmor_001358 [Zophobas morio]